MKKYENFNCVLPQSNVQEYPLYLGDCQSLKSKYIQENVKTIICCIKGFPIHNKVAKEHQCNIVIIQLKDVADQDIFRHFQFAYNQIEKGLKVGGVLVHCLAGISRSPSIVISYLMRKQKLTLDEAHKFVRQKRSCIDPNGGFMKQLRKYDEQLRLNKISEQEKQHKRTSSQKIEKPNNNQYLLNQKAKLLYAITKLKRSIKQ